MKNQIYQFLSSLTVAAYFIPLLVVFIRRLWKEKPYLLFGVYWSLNGIVNAIKYFDLASANTRQLITLGYNLIDMPLVLFFVYLSTHSPAVKRCVKYGAPLLLGAGLLNFSWQGWTPLAAKYMMGVGIFMVLVAVTWEFNNYMQKLEHTHQEVVMMHFYISLFFAYGTFVIVYVFQYYVRVNDSDVDNYLIYYISTLIAIFIATIGFLRKRNAPVLR